MGKTVFQKIIDREIPADIVYEDDVCVAFRDIDPQAPVHCLSVPKKVVPRLSEAKSDDDDLLGHLLLTVAKVAKITGVSETGFRTVINCGTDGGETVPHLHIHLLGGRLLQWPPG